MSDYDLAIVGAGAAGLIAADFALQLGARVALLEQDRIGGDCTWTGCVPSKSLLCAARTAHEARRASRMGVRLDGAAVSFSEVRQYLSNTIQQIYEPTSPASLRAKGLHIFTGACHFADRYTVQCGDHPIRARRMLICTGAVPRIPEIAGIDSVSYHTYRTIFQNDRIPQHLIVVGGGPVGCEIAQAYCRLGAKVTLFAPCLLPKEDPEVSQLLQEVFSREGITHVPARVDRVRDEGGWPAVQSAMKSARGDMLLIATGRVPAVRGLRLELAGVSCSEVGVYVNSRLQTSARHIYAAGDVTGAPQYSHLAGWQGFQAARNALLPGSASGEPEIVPRVTFTSPEVAHAGLTEAEARAKYRSALITRLLPLSKVDRAVNEDDRNGFLKMHVTRGGKIVGATIVAERAGEAVTEIALAMRNRIRVDKLAATVHPYPTYNSGIQTLATQIVMEKTLSGLMGIVLRTLARRG